MNAAARSKAVTALSVIAHNCEGWLANAAHAEAQGRPSQAKFCREKAAQDAHAAFDLVQANVRGGVSIEAES